MTKNVQRLSQVVSTFGPGSMIDLPTRSVIVAGLDYWDMGGNSFTTIPEPRLTHRLEQLLKAQGRIDPEAHLTLRTPPVSDYTGQFALQGVLAPVFPTWFVCEKTETKSGSTKRMRRLVRWQDLDGSQRRKFSFDDGKKSDVTPIRFVGACENGHIQDIDWRWLVHRGIDKDASCQEPMWIEEKGTSGDPADTSIVCNCGEKLSLKDAFQPGILGNCLGKRPWLLDNDPEGCSENLKFLTRAATNTYFPQVYTVISLPAEDDELSRLVDDLSGHLANVESFEDVSAAKKFNPNVSASLGTYSDKEIYDRLVRLRQIAIGDASKSPKISEFDVFASGYREIGINNSMAKLYAQTLPREQWDSSEVEIDLSSIRSLVAVHRLREVSCLYGFTRFESAPTSADGDIEDIRLTVRGAPLSKDADWLPAVEQFGEGLFIHFDKNAIMAWLQRPHVAERQEKLLRGYDLWEKHATGNVPKYPGAAYTLLHSLSHALMSEISLDCGYPASSLKERVYALPDSSSGNTPTRCGILIYTATPGAQGTLGGLVAASARFSSILKRALDRLRVCSNDPVCADHEPDGKSGDRATHGSACHGCLLVSETSCEMRNLFLDRDLLIPTMGGQGANFFE